MKIHIKLIGQNHHLKDPFLFLISYIDIFSLHFIHLLNPYHLKMFYDRLDFLNLIFY
jgi:hypothetical protein